MRNEMEPYPGRLTRAAHYTIATVFAAIIVLTFRLPNAVLGVYLPLLLMQDTPAASYKAAKTCMLFLFFATLWLTCGAVFVLGSPLLHFLFTVATLFLAAWLIEAGEDRAAAAGFGFYVANGIEVLDSLRSGPARLETILYTLLSIMLGIAIFVGVQYVLTFDRNMNGLRRGLDIRLRIVRDCLASLGGGDTPSADLQREVRRYSMLGGGRLRQVLSGLHLSPRVRDEQATALALITNMVDFANGLISQQESLHDEDRMRLRETLELVDGLRSDFQAGRVPKSRPLPALQSAVARQSHVYRLQYSAAILTQIFSSHLISDRLPEEKPRPRGLLRPNAFRSVSTLRFAIRSSLAGLFCYIVYWAVDWPGLSVSLITCIVTALSSTGASRQKQALRISGAMAGGILALVTQMFILPRVQSIGGFSLSLAVAIFAAMWVFTSSPRIAYAGRQMALCYELVLLSDPYFNIGLTQARDRVFGILLGLVAMWLIFDRLWSSAAAPQMLSLFDETVSLVASLPARGTSALADEVIRLRDRINNNFDKIRSLGDTVQFEFRRERHADLLLRSRIRSWLPLVRVIFTLRMSLLRRGIVQEPGVEDPSVDESVAYSSRILYAICGLEVSTPPKDSIRVLEDARIALRQTEIDDLPSLHLAASLKTVAAYLREDVLLDIAG